MYVCVCVCAEVGGVHNKTPQQWHHDPSWLLIAQLFITIPPGYTGAHAHTNVKSPQLMSITSPSHAHTHTNMRFHHSEEADGQLVVKNELAKKDNTQFCLSAHMPSILQFISTLSPLFSHVFPLFFIPVLCAWINLLSAAAHRLEQSMRPEVSDLTPLTSDSL